MAMTCDTESGGCGNTDAVRLSYSNRGCKCEKCGDVPTFQFSDVYFKQPYFDPNIADSKSSPLGNRIETRQQKAALLKQFGMREAGDKYHGAR